MEKNVKEKSREPSGSRDCWNRHGIEGDGTCSKLQEVIHCRNCEVYARAAGDLFEKEPPEHYLTEWTQYLAREKELETIGLLSLIIFRIGGEWLALPTELVSEITETRAAHTIPHRKKTILSGLINVQGKIQPCFSLGNLLGLEQEEYAGEEPDRKIFKRMIVLEREGTNWVFPVDEIRGVQRFQPEEIKNIPITVARAKNTYTKGVFVQQETHIAYLDHELLFNSLKRNVQ